MEVTHRKQIIRASEKGLRPEYISGEQYYQEWQPIKQRIIYSPRCYHKPKLPPQTVLWTRLLSINKHPLFSLFSPQNLKQNSALTKESNSYPENLWTENRKAAGSLREGQLLSAYRCFCQELRDLLIRRLEMLRGSFKKTMLSLLSVSFTYRTDESTIRYFPLQLHPAAYTSSLEPSVLICSDDPPVGTVKTEQQC